VNLTLNSSSNWMFHFRNYLMDVYEIYYNMKMCYLFCGPVRLLLDTHLNREPRSFRSKIALNTKKSISDVESNRAMVLNS
jgi:hypothetical protein